MECVRCKGMRKIICLSCGGSGETPNDNHYLADTLWEYRYVTCKECSG